MTESLEAQETHDAAAAPDRFEPPTLLGLINGHRRASAGVAAILVVFVTILVVSDLRSRSLHIGDSTPCSAWSSANHSQRDAYATLYLHEHGPLASGASDAATIERAIDEGCAMAYGFDEADTVTVIGSIRGQY
jgi:hypothetical protein